MLTAARGSALLRPLQLVLLPGLDATGTQHAVFAAAMQRHGVAVKVVAYPRDRALGYEALQAWVRQRLPVDDDYVLLGESFSGPIALAIAALPPPRLRGLILSTTFARSPWRALRHLQSLLYWAPARALPMQALSWLLLGRWSSLTLRTALAAALASVDAEVLRTRAIAALEVDVAPLARTLQVPVLCLHARHDRLLPARCQRHLSALLPAHATTTMEGPHLMLQARPEAAAACIRAFVHGVLGAH
ncbi:alpha/beta hydrolase [Bacillus subtilis subsp. subtilis]|nr:alpha/beta hydrolase [Bacillus subtilis subsp. subtilis]